ncbi:RNA polymerase sigma factor [Dyadobacter sp. CY356]|uniref:RNA polymerase sigma factor n=1 Tax=Dyadobacter sp. CY356 TaxID=2906442 RepID=UPI001F18BACC|nr:sigma-70 family RNA polymerase sigma factor [Dyadobacter sp. CY356]MCF0057936.1 sigma-70 family RNA polymerase sigma factor [Dyadobacter sp. CY356]
MISKSAYTELELISSLKGNSKEAFEYLYDHYASALYGIIMKIVKDEEKAADVMQDSFLKIWKNIDSYNTEKGTLFTWILNVARNTAIDRLRIDVKKENVVSWDTVAESEMGNNVIFNPIPATIDIRAIVSRLLPEKSILIDLVYFQGYTHEEVSEKLSLPLGTVKSRIRKALNELREIFDVGNFALRVA